MVLFGAALGIYVGVWLCLVGGIVAIMNELKSPEAVSAAVVAWGVTRIVLAGPLGWVSALFFLIPGLYRLSSNN